MDNITKAQAVVALVALQDEAERTEAYYTELPPERYTAEPYLVEARTRATERVQAIKMAVEALFNQR